MKIIVGKLSGFCAGVTYTVNKAKEILTEHKKIYCLGEIVHNERVIKMLQEEGMITVESIEDVPNGVNVIFRAHGEAEGVYERAKEKNIHVIDLTCGKVRKIHLEVQREKEDRFIIIIGKKTHPETIGTKGFAGDSSIVIDDEAEVKKALEEFQKTGLNGVYVVSQTTFSTSKFNNLIDKIKNTFDGIDVVVNNTICDATEKRQKEVEELSKNVDKMFIIGGKNSSNTKELAVISEKNCKEVYLIQDKKELQDIIFKENNVVGIVSGASTPKETVIEIKKYLERIDVSF